MKMSSIVKHGTSAIIVRLKAFAKATSTSSRTNLIVSSVRLRISTFNVIPTRF